MKTIHKYSVLILCSVLFAVSCVKNGAGDGSAPEIYFDMEEPVFTTKAGQELVIEPVVRNAGSEAVYMWKIEGEIVSRESSLTYLSDKVGSVFGTFQVANDYGKAEKEIRIDVLSLLAPEIVMAIPEGGYSVVVGGELAFTPEVSNSDSAEFAWTVNGERKGDQKDFTFSSDKTGEYKIVFTAKNGDGEDVLELSVNVCTPEEMPFEWLFETTTYNISIGRTAFIRSYWISNAFDATYSWTVDGGSPVQEGKECLYAYTPSSQGEHTVTVTMKNKYVQRVKSFVVNVCPPEGSYRRAVTASSGINADHGYFYLPAPSQHVNRGSSPRPFSSQDDVNAYVYDHPTPTEYGGSLGAWGGYIVVGFDHSIASSGDYDLEIEGNAFPGSSEPGIVWVMQDENGDGLPNDTWYELKGSAYRDEGYLQDYAVVYYRGENGKNIVWQDNQGKTGTIDYIQEHTPATMYPRWLNSASYVLVGSRLPSRTRETSPGYWTNDDFEWGYVDNYSEKDMLKDGGNPGAGYVGNHMKISDAVTFDGKPADLQYIDFVKVQTGLNVKAGWLGENSTEVGAIRDFNMKR